MSDLTALSLPGQVTVTRNNNMVNIDFAITDSNEAPVDLTGATVIFKMALPEADYLKVNGLCTITSYTGGLCSYALTSSDLNTAGVFLGALEITFANGRILTIRDIIVNVENNLPRGTLG